MAMYSRAKLARRQQDVLNLISKGYSNKEIAEALTISPQSVKNHVTRLMLKLGTRNRTQLALLASKGLEAGEVGNCPVISAPCRHTDCPLWSGEFQLCLLRKVTEGVAEYMARQQPK